jgi:hypothetical protein
VLVVTHLEIKSRNGDIGSARFDGANPGQIANSQIDDRRNEIGKSLTGSIVNSHVWQEQGLARARLGKMHTVASAPATRRAMGIAKVRIVNDAVVNLP